MGDLAWVHELRVGLMRNGCPGVKVSMERVVELDDEIIRLRARVAELEAPTYYWDDRDLDNIVDLDGVMAYDDVGDILPFRPIHELPTRWALVTTNGLEWFASQAAAEARWDELGGDNPSRAVKAGGDDA